MIELVSVQVVNFRSFGEAVFTPLGIGQGMTAINGPNGSGKSSLAAHAILWALYGVTPDGVPVRALRRQGSEGDVRVVVTFRHEGQVVVVERALKGRKDTTIARIEVEGVEQTSVSSRSASQWVAQRLGIDADGFVTAFVVKQKEVDALVRARPAERRALIERLGGIEQMAQALTRARELARIASARAEGLRETRDADVAATEADEAEATAELRAERAESLQAEADEAEVVAQGAAQRFQELEAAASAVTDARHALELAQHALSACDSEVERLQRAAEGAEDVADLRAELADAEERLRGLVAAVESARPVVAESEREQARAEEAEAIVAASEREYAGIQARLDELRVSTVADPASILNEAKRIEMELEACSEAIGSHAGEERRLARAIDALESDGDDSTCPTCLGSIHDVASLRARLGHELAECQHHLRDVASRKESLAEQLAELRQQWRDASNQVNLIESLNSEATRSLERLSQQRVEAARAGERAEEAAERAHVAYVAAKEAEESLPLAKTRVEDASRHLRRAEAARDAAEQLGASLSLREIEQEKVREAESRLAVALSTLGDHDLAKERAALETLRVDASVALRAATVAQGESQEARHRAREARRVADEAKAQAEARRLALLEVERAQNVASALEEFRRDRVARLAPELAEVASDLLSTMTEGKYSSVELDEDFTPIVTEAATGLERPTSWLSGGEESAVALALRIAVGEVVAGQRGGLLILDEVLTAQDQIRRNATMGAIRALPRQVITINHVSEATDMVDLVAHVSPAGDDGSVVEHAAVESGALIWDDDDETVPSSAA